MQKTNQQDFTPQKTESKYVMEIHAPAEKVFPLLCPVREYEWIPDWDCDVLFTESGVAEDLCVFNRENKSFGKETWVCTRYEPPKLIHYTRFSQNKIVRLEIQWLGGDQQASKWEWKTVCISLDESGDKQIENYRKTDALKIAKGLEYMLEHFVTRGEMLHIH